MNPNSQFPSELAFVRTWFKAWHVEEMNPDLTSLGEAFERQALFPLERGGGAGIHETLRMPWEGAWPPATHGVHPPALV